MVLFCVVSVLQEDQPYPDRMNKARILLLAQNRSLKGDSDKDECLSGIGAREKGVISDGAEASVQGSDIGERHVSLKRTRPEAPEGSTKGLQRAGPLVISEKKVSTVPDKEEVMEVIPSGDVTMLRGGVPAPFLAKGLTWRLPRLPNLC